MVKLNEKVDELKKKLILDTASEYFKTFGYEKTQIDKIAKDLSVGVGTIYGYFKSKEGLFMAWLAYVIENASAEMQEFCADIINPIEKLKMIVKYKMKYFEKNKLTIKGYMENNELFLRGISRRKEHPMRKVYGYCAEIIKQLKPMDDNMAYLFATTFDAIINSYIECSFEEGNILEKQDEIVGRFLRFVGV